MITNNVKIKRISAYKNGKVVLEVTGSNDVIVIPEQVLGELTSRRLLNLEVHAAKFFGITGMGYNPNTGKMVDHFTCRRGQYKKDAL